MTLFFWPIVNTSYLNWLSFRWQSLHKVHQNQAGVCYKRVSKVLFSPAWFTASCFREKCRQHLKQQMKKGFAPYKEPCTHTIFLCHEQLVVMTFCYWSCRNTLETWSSMSSDMAQGEALELVNGLCGEAAGESWLSLLSHPAETLVIEIAPSLSQNCVLPSVLWPWRENHLGRRVRIDFWDCGTNFNHVGLLFHTKLAWTNLLRTNESILWIFDSTDWCLSTVTLCIMYEMIDYIKMDDMRARASLSSLGFGSSHQFI